ncbi:hypothetical protein A3D00_02985 [Candidatus Woesebacteria bacterium RIFCSPHIGHO2_02_FULL_38_9]|uniref:Uncharacterized protein n=1 Tax=Candidatus Woesebacteria bacterium RIFCSPHIGHO2_01_FULL_39_28 TaxID=1802496 RepID=A0A1F7YFQ0_9BACT|nr:MAG: hypothetical protein A2627_03940 [Candidatus Woesebacteria bacterium RIFCSPHIGHO2_01_FULL_39_28]OGM35347.1 MAG: hypothetical protein A3D00_02985 [Candidatus Woesebacteria bacterium RIFCSPHIGHO2_02_FULL_38_9]OGM57242.1 MAG: hypothetical protein A3A50_00500 [Candidatus Woesebacteria bacterium RIFCSPLOWO2_01_FULL_38_20]
MKECPFNFWQQGFCRNHPNPEFCWIRDAGWSDSLEHYRVLLEKNVKKTRAIAEAEMVLDANAGVLKRNGRFCMIPNQLRQILQEHIRAIEELKRAH